jgi:hypothetical protein
MPGQQTENMALWDENGAYSAKVDSEQRLWVNATTKPGTANQNNRLYYNIAVPKNGGSSFVDYIIPNGKVYTAEEFNAGSLPNKGVMEIWFGEPATNEAGMNREKIIISNGGTDSLPFVKTFTGNGTKVLRIKLTNHTATDDRMFAEIIGFEV